MDRRSLLELIEVLKTYFDFGEFLEFASAFNVSFDVKVFPDWISVSKQLIEKLEHGNHRALLEKALETADIRNTQAIGTSRWATREFHEALSASIRNLRAGLGEAAIPSELAVSENKPFSAKSEVREFLEKAETEVLVVDPYVGAGTLDCFRSLKKPIRLLTGNNPQSIEPGFVQSLKDFKSEGFQIEVRQHQKLHDRHVVFNDRCWLVGSSLKHAGQKAFHAIEIVDAKAEVIAGLETKWTAGKTFP